MRRQGSILFTSFFLLLILGLLLIIASETGTLNLRTQRIFLDVDFAHYLAKSGLERGRYHLRKGGEAAFPLVFEATLNGQSSRTEIAYQAPLLLATATFGTTVAFLSASCTRRVAAGSTPQNGDYLSFGGREWILLDQENHLVICKNSIGEMVFNDPRNQIWDRAGQVASLCAYLNGAWYDAIDPTHALVKTDSAFEIEAGHAAGSGAAYTWTGKIGLLTLTQFSSFQTNGPDLRGTSQRAITQYNGDLHMDSKWWLLTPASNSPDKVLEVSGGATDSSNTDQPSGVRPLLNLNPGYTVLSGSGAYGDPYVIAP